MTKKDKLFLLIFILSSLSIIIAIPLKLLGINLFNINLSFNLIPINLEYILNIIINIVQFYLIIGCITFYEPSKLIIKILPYLPLTILLYFLPQNTIFPLSLIILLATCLSLRPKFSTIISFIINIIVISMLQLLLIWLKLNIINYSSEFPNFINLFLMHIDEFIILGSIYFVTRKWGDEFVQKLAIFRRNG